jgi:putative glycosyltransferase (TIGR04372 family)
MNVQCARERKTSSFLRGVNAFVKNVYLSSTVLTFPIALFLKWLGVRVLDVKYECLGHLAIDPDLYLRDQAQLKQKIIPILFAPYQSLIKERPFSSLVSNRFLLKCWKRHFLVIDNLILYVLLYPILKSPLLQYSPRHYLAPKASPEYIKGRDWISVYKRSEAAPEGLSALVKLTEKEEKMGEAALAKLGVPPNAWFVCFSCREPGYYTKQALNQSSCRNASIDRLDLAIEEVVKRGGWCLRVGSPFSPLLPDSLARHPQVIDYTKTKERSDFMDVYLAAKCRFVIGNLSGLTDLPRVFGVPCVLVNIVPFGFLTPRGQALHVFKLLASKKTGKLIPFTQCLQSLLSFSSEDEDYREFGIELIENTAEEIRDVTIEMLDRFDSRLSYSKEDDELQAEFLSLMNSYNLGYGASARIGRNFLRKYKSSGLF